MPERPLTIATYAAGASLAAATLIYVFGPTFFLDDEASNSSRSSRKKGVVGLVNPANDCFINSILQALAGLPGLRIYLIEELHRRKLDGPELYKDLSPALELESKKEKSKRIPEWELLGLQQGLVTAGLKEIIDSLNERPIYKKTISAQPFVRVVEASFRTRISRNQQDAHEFLQLVAERLDDEYHAAKRVRGHASRKQSAEESKQHPPAHLAQDPPVQQDETAADDAPTFPLEGKLESQVECLHCQFTPKPTESSFVSLTLHVPQGVGATSLNKCLDGVLKVEHIDDFTCDRCRLENALQLVDKQLSKTSLAAEIREQLVSDKIKLQTAILEDPEKPPADVKLPESASTPKRQITRHMRISSFPRILAIHLSRSVWDSYSNTSKNMAKVSFPESLPLGGLLERKNYRLLGTVTHKGGHNSGHYESFRRQMLNPPFSTPNSMGTEGIYSVRSSAASSPQISAQPSPLLKSVRSEGQPLSSLSQTPSPSAQSTDLSTPSTQSSIQERRRPNSHVPFDAIPTPGLPQLPSQQDPPKGPTQPRSSMQTDTDASRRSRSITENMSLRSRGKRKTDDRWWRISDEKIKECKTADVLSMQREVYLLFYEMVDSPAAS